MDDHTFLTPFANGQDALGEDFPKRPEIEKRLAAANAGLAESADTNAELRDHLQQLTAICQYHLAAIDVLAKARTARDQAAQELGSWHGFPPPRLRTGFLAQRLQTSRPP